MTETTKRPVRIMEGELQTAEYARSHFVLTAPPGSTPEDFLEAETFAHVAGRKVKANDILEVWAEDRTWRAEIVIVECREMVVQAALLQRNDFQPVTGKEYEAFDPQYAGPTARWRVLRKSDRAVMVDKLESKSAAFAWIEQNAKAPLKQAA